jgi:hypothetical protein
MGTLEHAGGPLRMIARLEAAAGGGPRGGPRTGAAPSVWLSSFEVQADTAAAPGRP